MYRVGHVTDIQTTLYETLLVTTDDYEITVAATHRLFVKKWKRTMFQDAEMLEPDDRIF